MEYTQCSLLVSNSKTTIRIGNKNMNLAEQMQAQIALNKALPLIQMQLTNNSFALVDYQDGLRELLIQNGFDVSYNQRECQLVVKFKTNTGFWSNR